MPFDEVTHLFKVAPFHSAAVYQAIFYLGLRRNEIHSLKGTTRISTPRPPCFACRHQSRRTVKATSRALRPELVTTLHAIRTAHAGANDFVYSGTVPRIHTFKTDLKAAGIEFEDERASRIDLHGLRTTFVTQLLANGADPYAVMKLARHSDIRLTTEPTRTPRK